MTRPSTLLAALALLAAGPAPAQSPGQGLPNIVVVLADDMGYGDPGVYNPASRIPTPHIDRLAASGMRFTDAHTPSSVCTPTRYGLLTGRYAWRTRMKSGVLQGYDPLLIEPGRLTVASMLKRAGYATAVVGKWHLGLGSEKPVDYARPLAPGPNAVGFDEFFGIPASLDMDPYLFVENERPEVPPTDSIGDSARRRDGGPGFWRRGAIAPGFRHIDVLPRLAERAVSFVERSARGERPFFLYLPLTGPHTPWLPTAEWEGRSGAGAYGDFSAQVDGVLGQVMEALRRTGVADNTLVVFTSDNGSGWREEEILRYGHRSNGPWRGQKADIHEGGHRVPFVAAWPGRIAAGSVSDQTIALTDLMATLAEVAGQRLPGDSGEDSYSILPVLLGTAAGRPVREATVHHSSQGLFAIRQGPWKLVEGLGSGGFTAPARVQPGPGDPRGQLYHLGDDPAESRNLYAQRPEVVARLKTLLDRYRNAERSAPVR